MLVAAAVQVKGEASEVGRGGENLLLPVALLAGAAPCCLAAISGPKQRLRGGAVILSGGGLCLLGGGAPQGAEGQVREQVLQGCAGRAAGSQRPERCAAVPGSGLSACVLVRTAALQRGRHLWALGYMLRRHEAGWVRL